MKQHFSMQWMPLWAIDGMKVMPFLFVAKYDWHYSDAGMEMLRLFRSELFLFLLKTHQENVHLSLLADVHRDSEHRIWPYQIPSPQRSWLRTLPRSTSPEYPCLRKD